MARRRDAAARAIITGLLMIAAGFVLLLFVHLPVVVLASVLMAAVGATFVRGGFKVLVRR